MKTFTIDDIRKWDPCYDPSRYLPDDWSGTVIDMLRIEKIPPDDRLWVVLREELIDSKTIRLFAVWCARQVEHLLIDDRSRTAIALAEKFAHHQATREDLFDAQTAARVAAWAATRAATRAANQDAAQAAQTSAQAAWAAAWAAQTAAWDATRAATRAAARAAAWAAQTSAQAAWVAAWVAAWDAAQAATRAAAWAAQTSARAAQTSAQAAQIAKLIEMVEEE